MEAILALEDGRIFHGIGFGALSGGASPRSAAGEVVFNTSLTGYQEIFTDPSYAGQIVCLTNPEIGNYGTNLSDEEAARPYIEGLVVREFSPVASNWRSEELCQGYLERQGIAVISELDTRALVRHLRQHGVKRGVIGLASDGAEALIARARAIPRMDGLDLACKVTTAKSYDWAQGLHPLDQSFGEDAPAKAESRFHVIAYDFGIKRNILRQLTDKGCRVTVVPAKTSAEDVLALRPDGVFLSNGPGDPEPCTYAHDNLRRLAGRTPLFGICLGHQLLGLALGGKTYKLKFGHHGGNHPVRNESNGKIEITAHNHNFAVDPDSLKNAEVDLTHWDLNDQTLEGMRHRTLPLFSVQYHPEAAPGPHDSHYLFDDFVRMMGDWKKNAKKN